jgi:hypothetical protein
MGGEVEVTDFPTALEGRELSCHEAIGRGSGSTDGGSALLVREILSDLCHEFVDINLLHVVHKVSLSLL